LEGKSEKCRIAAAPFENKSDSYRGIKRSDTLFVSGMITLIALLLLASATGAYFIFSRVVSTLTQLSN